MIPTAPLVKSPDLTLYNNLSTDGQGNWVYISENQVLLYRVHGQQSEQSDTLPLLTDEYALIAQFVMNSIICACTTRNVIFIDIGGDSLFEASLHNLSTMNDFVATCITWHEGHVYLSTSKGELLCFEISNRVIHFLESHLLSNNGNAIWDMSLNSDTLIISYDDGKIECIDQNWNILYKINCKIPSSVVFRAWDKEFVLYAGKLDGSIDIYHRESLICSIGAHKSMVKCILETENGFASVSENQASFWEIQYSPSLSVNLSRSFDIPDKQISGMAREKSRYLIASANDYFLFQTE